MQAAGGSLRADPAVPTPGVADQIAQRLRHSRRSDLGQRGFPDFRTASHRARPTAMYAGVRQIRSHLGVAQSLVRLAPG